MPSVISRSYNRAMSERFLHFHSTTMGTTPMNTGAFGKYSDSTDLNSHSAPRLPLDLKCNISSSLSSQQADMTFRFGNPQPSCKNQFHKKFLSCHRSLLTFLLLLFFFLLYDYFSNIAMKHSIIPSCLCIDKKRKEMVKILTYPFRTMIKFSMDP